MRRKAILYGFVMLYAVAGIMHFATPEIYLEVIPDWLGDKRLINYSAGLVELIIAVMALFSRTRKTAGIITIFMLLAFVISHVYFIQNGSCAGDVCISAWIGWMRLVVIHPLLIYWAWKISRL